MSTSSSISSSSQMRQYYRPQPTNNHANQGLLQQQPQQLHQPQQLLQPQVITNQSHPTYNLPVITNGTTNARVTNTQQRNALRNSVQTTSIPASEIIDLSSPPTSPVPQPAVLDTVRSTPGWELKRMPERSWQHDSPNSIAYKVSFLFYVAPMFFLT